MLWALLPLLFLSFILGFTAIERDMSTVTPQAMSFQTSAASIAAQEFMSYRDAVTTYGQCQLAQQESIIYAPCPLATYPLIKPGYFSPSGITAPAGAQAVIVSDQSGAGGYDICVWMPAPLDTIEQAIRLSHGDLTIGSVVNSGQWMQAAIGGVLQQIPCVLAGVTPPLSGYIISVVGLGGN